MKQRFSVEGMMCAACQANVGRTVSSLGGVNSCNVSLLSKSMIVEFDQDKVSEKEIISAVNKSGYKASIYVNESLKKEKEKEQKELIKKRNKIIISVILLAIFMVFSMGFMIPPVMEWVDQSPHTSLICVLTVTAQIVLLIPIVVINFNHFVSGFKSLFKLHPNMDALVALGCSVSILYGSYVYISMLIDYVANDVASVMSWSMNIYFESAAMILVFISLGKYFEAKATSKTKSSINSLISLIPDTAIVLKDNVEVEVLTEQLEIGDLVVVKPGTSIPTDGEIVSGYGNIDESAITGESLPIYKKEGEKVIGSTINKEGSFIFKVTSVGKDTTIAKIINLVDVAANSKAPLARLADKISLIFVPLVIITSLVTLIYWATLTATGQIGTNSRADWSLVIQLTASVLVISCPCALGLATPVAIMVGTGIGAENGILIKSAEAFEKLSSVDYILFDKTGTLTKGEIIVENVVGNFDKKLLTNIMAVESNSEHPLSKAIVSYCAKNEVKLVSCSDFKNYPGRGVSGNGVIIGNKLLMSDFNIDISAFDSPFKEYASKGYIVLYVATNEVKGLFILGDEIKDSSAESLKTLQKLGKKIAILTGDDVLTSQNVAAKLGVDDFYANILPDEKESIVKQLQKANYKVAMVGDGINDAPALTRADVGIAIGAGTDIAIESSDIILVKNDLYDVVRAVELSKSVVKNIKENLAWAFCYNLVLIPLAAGVLYGVTVTPNWFTGYQAHLVLTPMIASIAMSISSVTVVLNALRLKFIHRKKGK